MKPFRKSFTPAFTSILILAFSLIPVGSLWAEESSTIFLVRHAEKTEASDDPALSEAGKLRAHELARVLRNAGIQHIYSTDYTRTRDTAAPLAALLKLELELYDPRELAEFAAKLKCRGSRQLVIGHSNTTPELVALLGGDPGEEIDESGEYDRLYIVSIDASGVTSLLIRYGSSSEI